MTTNNHSRDTLIHLVAGGVAGTIGAVVTCPLEVVKTRLQSSTNTFLYENVHVPKIASNDRNTSHVTCKTISSEQRRHISTLNHRLSNHVLTFSHYSSPPSYHPNQSMGLIQCIKNIIEHEGPRSLFKGLGPNIVGVAPSRAIYFCAYSQSKKFFNSILTPDTAAVHIISASFAGFSASSLTNPIWFVKTRLQLDNAKNGHKLTTNQCVKRIYNQATSKFEKELHGIRGFSNEEILSSESYEPSSNEWDNVKHSTTYDQKAPPYSEQWTWPNSESTIKKIPSPYMIRSDQRLHSIPQELGSTKRSSIQIPGVQSIRRMSLAALNFISSSKLAGRMAPPKDPEKDVELNKDEKTRRTGRTACPRKNTKKRYSLCNMEYDSMCQYINYFTQTKMKESNIINILKNQIGNLENSSTISPVLEQTSIGDFLRVVNSLQSTSNYYTTAAADETRPQTSPLWTLFQNEPKPPDINEKSSNDPTSLVTQRRYSLAPPTPGRFNISRNKSFSTNIRKISPSVFTKNRTYSNPALSIPQIRRIRSESTSTDQSEPSTATTVRSRKIRRFSVKPVYLASTMPEIVVDDNCDKPNPNDVQVHVESSPSTLESLRIEK